MTTSKKLEQVKCPSCGKTLPLKPHPEKTGRMVAVCDCLKRTARPVLETDAKAKKSEVKDV